MYCSCYDLCEHAVIDQAPIPDSSTNNTMQNTKQTHKVLSIFQHPLIVFRLAKAVIDMKDVPTTAGKSETGNTCTSSETMQHRPPTTRGHDTMSIGAQPETTTELQGCSSSGKTLLPTTSYGSRSGTVSSIQASHSSTGRAPSGDVPPLSSTSHSSPYGMQRWLVQDSHNEPWNAVGHGNSIFGRDVQGSEGPQDTEGDG